MGSMIVNGFDLRKRGEMVCFSVERGSLVGRGGEVLDTDAVLDEPFVNRLCRMGHEYTAAEVGLCQDIGKGRCMVEMETRSSVISRL